ncbi:MAG: inositol monophosphatase family protein [Verrucomicrobiota bacterium]
MNLSTQKKALHCAIEAARAAGKVMTKNFRSAKKVNSASQFDIKLELDVRCQKLIQKKLASAFPEVALLGEEGNDGDANADYRWVVDPIDGTVNFSYEIPHSCVSIALQKKDNGDRTTSDNPSRGRASNPVNRHPSHVTLLGVVYDPFCDELWMAIRGQPARLNGRIIQVSKKKRLEDAIISIGFGKTDFSVQKTLVYFCKLVPRIRKVRIMGAGALAMVYVASGRFDAYIESQISLWDIAAGGLILECAGGEFWNEPIAGPNAYRLLANNGLLRSALERIG